MSRCMSDLRDPSLIAALVLAAGAATRYRAVDPGVATKLTVLVDGIPMVRRVALAARASRASPIIVVTGHAATAVEAALADLDVATVHNEAFAEGLAGSLETGLAALPPEAQGLIVLLGDMPAVTTALLDRLIDAFATNRDVDAVVPVHDGRRGNPALLGRALFPAVARLRGDEGARRLLAGARTLELAVGDPGILFDVDAPGMLRAATAWGDPT